MLLRNKKRLFLLCTLMAIAVLLLYKHPMPDAISVIQEKSSSNEKNLIKMTEKDILSRLQDIEKYADDYLVYDCLANSGRCGGWNDRVTGVINTVLMALLINKKFRLTITTPCETKEFFEPNKFDWTLTPDIISNKNIAKINFLDLDIFKLDLRNVGCHFMSSVNYFRSNWDVLDVFRVTPHIRKQIPWICSMHHADIYKMMIEMFFKPTKKVLDPISRLPLDKSKKLVCAHVRMGTNPLDKSHKFAGGQRFPYNRTRVLFDFLNDYDTDAYQMYIASDSPMLKENIKKKFPKRFVDIPGEIVLVDIDRGKGACDAYAKGFSEWWILTMCDVLVLTKSGFGMMAAYLRDDDKPLYFLDSDNVKIVPCNRYDVLEHISYEMHIPTYFPIYKRSNITHDYCPPGELQLHTKLPKLIKDYIGLMFLKVTNSLKCFKTTLPPVLLPFLGIAYSNDPDGFASWNVQFLVGSPKLERQRVRNLRRQHGRLDTTLKRGLVYSERSRIPVSIPPQRSGRGKSSESH